MPTIDAATSANALTAQLAALARMSKAALQRRYLEVFGEPTRSCNEHHLRFAIAMKLREQSVAAEAEAAAASTRGVDMPQQVGARDPRLPPSGTTIERVVRGVVHRVRVLDDGFEYGGARLPSLSAVAKRITGTSWNGLRFFGLTNDKTPATAPAGRSMR